MEHQQAAHSAIPGATAWADEPSDAFGKRLPRRRVFYQSQPSATVLANFGYVRNIVDKFERLHDWRVNYDASDLRGGRPTVYEVPFEDEEDSDDSEAEEIGVDNTFYVGSRTVACRRSHVPRVEHKDITPESTIVQTLHPVLEGKEDEEDEEKGEDEDGKDIEDEEDDAQRYSPLQQPPLYPNGTPASGQAEARFWLNSKEATYLSDDDEYSEKDDECSDDEAVRTNAHRHEPTSPSESFSFNLQNRRLADATRGNVASPKPGLPNALSKRGYHRQSPRGQPFGKKTAQDRQTPQLPSVQAEPSPPAPEALTLPLPPPLGPPSSCRVASPSRPRTRPLPGLPQRQVSPSEQAPRAISEITTANTLQSMAPGQQSLVEKSQNRYHSRPALQEGRRLPVVNEKSTSTDGARGMHPQHSGTRPAESAALRRRLQEAAAEEDEQRRAVAVPLVAEYNDRPSLVRRLKNRRVRGRKEAKAPQPHVVNINARANAVEPSRRSAY